jgi:TRAP-type uncharacterized transport system fused permease subunit
VSVLDKGLWRSAREIVRVALATVLATVLAGVVSVGSSD